MRFLILSDLHIEFHPFRLAPDCPPFDAIILAGDTMADAAKLPRWAARPSQFGLEKPIIVVAGNHEYYGEVLQSSRAQMLEAGIPNVHVLSQGEVMLDQGRVRVLGCTLWTDFECPVQTAHGPRADARLAMDEAASYMNDYRAIRFQRPDRPTRKLRPEDTLAMHIEERAWLLGKLREPFDGATVVVTHHGPSIESVSRAWEADWLTPAFVSHLPDEFFDVPALWVHGHVHTSFDYVRGRTRVLTNPRGYQTRDGSSENRNFDHGMVIDVP